MTSASTPTLHAEPLPDFILVRTDEVREGDRLRPVDPIWATALGQIMLREGQDTPIQVCRLPGQSIWMLVAGAHRLAGAISAGIEYLRAEVVGADRDDRRLREVRENLWRSDLAPIDRAAFIAEAVSIYKSRAGLDANADGRVASVTARWQKVIEKEAVDTTATIASVYGWSDKVGEQIGLSARTIRDDLMLYRRLAPSLVERLREARHPILTNATQLRALAKLEPAVQADALAALVGDGWEPCKTVAEAVARSQPDRAKPRQDAGTRLFSTVLGSIQRMSAADRIALFQSPQFHDMIPAEARALLAPMRRDPVSGADDGQAAVPTEDGDRPAPRLSPTWWIIWRRPD